MTIKNERTVSCDHNWINKKIKIYLSHHHNSIFVNKSLIYLCWRKWWNRKSHISVVHTSTIRAKLQMEWKKNAVAMMSSLNDKVVFSCKKYICFYWWERVGKSSFAWNNKEVNYCSHIMISRINKANKN